MVAKAKTSFKGEFWNSQNNCLFDLIVNGSTTDDLMRPNQIIAATLDYPIIEMPKSELLVDSILHELPTPCGLRTLATNDARLRYEKQIFKAEIQLSS